jgi:hypothetical protein
LSGRSSPGYVTDADAHSAVRRMLQLQPLRHLRGVIIPLKTPATKTPAWTSELARTDICRHCSCLVVLRGGLEMFGWFGRKDGKVKPEKSKRSKPGPAKLEDVFVAPGVPTITYVSRPKLESEIKRHLEHSREMLLFIGPTKSGKTVLMRTIIPETGRIVVHGGSVEGNAARFWESVAAGAGAARSVVTTDVVEDKSVTRTKAGISMDGNALGGIVGVPLPGLELGRSTERTRHEGQGIQRVLFTDPQEEAIRLLIASKRVLVIEDFHLVHADVQRTVMRALKNRVEEGLKLIVMGIPHRENDVVAGVIDMQGRTRTLRMPMWEKEDLRKICDQGFKALNIEPAANVVAQFCNHAFGSPNLLQKFCNHLCKKHALLERQAKTKKVSLGERYETFFEEFVEGEANLDVTRIVADFRSPNESRMKRFKVRGGEDMNIYQLVLLAISKKLPATMIAAGDISLKIEDLVDGEHPEPAAITNALRRLATLAHEISQDLKIGQPVLEYDPKLRRLHITDASFAFHVKWGRI